MVDTLNIEFLDQDDGSLLSKTLETNYFCARKLDYYLLDAKTTRHRNIQLMCIYLGMYRARAAWSRLGLGRLRFDGLGFGQARRFNFDLKAN
jgi:hypothetical protein